MAITAFLHASKPTLRFFCTNIRSTSGILMAARRQCPAMMYTTCTTSGSTLAPLPVLQSFGGGSPLTIKRCKSTGKSAHASSHVGMWAAERLTAVAAVFIFPVIFYIESPPLEMAMCVVSVMHSHWGFESVIRDYIQPHVLGPFITPFIQKLAVCNLYVLSIVTLAGLAFLIFNGDGIAKTIQLFWSIR